MSSKKRTPPQPATVKYVVRVIREELAKIRRLEIIRNATRARSEKFVPQSIRDYWNNRLYVYWDDYRTAWVICDNNEDGVDSLIFYPYSEQWAVHRDMQDWESKVSHTQAAALARSLYRLTPSFKNHLDNVHYH